MNSPIKQYLPTYSRLTYLPGKSKNRTRANHNRRLKRGEKSITIRWHDLVNAFADGVQKSFVFCVWVIGFLVGQPPLSPLGPLGGFVWFCVLGFVVLFFVVWMGLSSLALFAKKKCRPQKKPPRCSAMGGDFLGRRRKAPSHRIVCRGTDTTGLFPGEFFASKFEQKML